MVKLYVAGPVAERGDLEGVRASAAALYTRLESAGSKAGVSLRLPWRDGQLSSLDPRSFAEQVYDLIDEADALLLVVLAGAPGPTAYSLGCEAQRAKERRKAVALLSDDVASVPRLLLAIADGEQAYDLAAVDLADFLSDFAASLEKQWATASY